MEAQSPQFRLRTLFLGTTVIAVYLGLLSRKVDVTEIIVVLVVSAPLLVLVPKLVIRAAEPELDLRDFGPATTIWMVIASFYSIFMVYLSAKLFEPTHQTAKGPEWYYYLHDLEAGLASLPLYAVGAIATGFALANFNLARQSLLVLLLVATSSLIALWYVVAIVAMNFVANDIEGIAILPFTAALIHACVAIVIARQFQWSALRLRIRVIEFTLGWLVPLALTLYLKIYKAQQLFARLPAESAGECFVVTAACGGHERFVQRRIDPETLLPINDQLRTLRQFEVWLKRRGPRLHVYLRRVYNVVGPLVASRIRWAWQADCVYLLLKPIEWSVRVLRLRA